MRRTILSPGGGRLGQQGELLDAVKHLCAPERITAFENAEFIRHTNEWVEKYGLPLAEHRMF
jgi:hypothetical protein